MLYAGEGTFWTDLSKFSDVLIGRQTDREIRGKSGRTASGK
jgi:hypothetical protein